MLRATIKLLPALPLHPFFVYFKFFYILLFAPFLVLVAHETWGGISGPSTTMGSGAADVMFYIPLLEFLHFCTITTIFVFLMYNYFSTHFLTALWSGMVMATTVVVTDIITTVCYGYGGPIA